MLPDDGDTIPTEEILRPDGPGSETNITNASGCVNHWGCVDEETADDDVTRVYTSALGVYERDLYTLQDHSASGVMGIDSVIVHFRAMRGDAKASIRTHGTIYDSSENSFGSWTDYYYPKVSLIFLTTSQNQVSDTSFTKMFLYL